MLKNQRRLHPHLAAALLVSWIACAHVHAEDAFPVAIQVDAGTKLGELKPIWRFFGCDEPNYATMKHGRKLLSELGKRAPNQVFFRTHNLLCTGDGTPAHKWGSTNAYREDANGNPVYDWTILDRIFDAYLQNGVRPYVQIGFMPKDLSIRPEPYQHDWEPGDDYDRIFTGWSYPPKDYEKWEELVYQWTKHCVDKYGAEEVAAWYWQTWNEADIGYWRGRPREESFHRLHDHAIAGVRRALPNARVGGPDAAYDGRFIRNFLEHCLYGINYATGEKGTPLDFIAFHAKGGPSIHEGHVRMGIAQHLRAISSSMEVVASFPELKDTPIVIGESDPDGCAACGAHRYPQYGYRNGTLYASYTAASFARKYDLARRHGVNLEGALTWAFEFEDQPYFVGYRTLATNGIDKPVLNVFRMFSKMRGERLEVESDHAVALDRMMRRGVRGRPDVSALACQDESTLAVMVWHYHDDDVRGPDAKVELTLSGWPMAADSIRARHFRIDEDHSNSFTAWKRMGSPQQPSADQYAELEKAGQLAEIAAPQIRTANGEMEVSVVLPRQAVSLLVFEPSDAEARNAEKTSASGESARAAAQSPQRRGRRSEPRGIYKSRIEPHWFADNSRLWYRNRLRDDQKEFVLVDVEAGTRRTAFDHAKLAEALSDATKKTYAADELPFDRIEFIDDGKAIQFVAEEAQWEWKLDADEVEKLGDAPETVEDDDESDDRWRRWRGRFRRDGNRRREGGGPSPDGEWHAFVRDHNVYLRPADEDEDSDDDEGHETKKRLEFQLTVDGVEKGRYGMLQWSPDSKRLVAFRIEPGDNKEVYLIESSPEGGGRAKLRSRPYDLPGDKLTSFELHLFDVEQKKQIKPDVERIDLHYPRLYWNRDGRHFAYEKVDRGHQRLRIIRVDSHTSETANIIDEKTDTFIWTAHTENLDLDRINWLPDSDEAIYVSERDGWRHLYLLDTKEGGIKHQITQGEYVVRGIDRIDEEKRQIWFHASGKNADQDPYFMHYYRVNFDGSGLVALTEADGHHSVQFSPDQEYLIDTYSRVDAPPKHELRRADNGELVCSLEEADAEELVAGLSEAGHSYHPLEAFVAKGRDGKTDIWGVICRPRDFDPNKKYPIIESIYAGPQGSFVPKSFGGGGRYAELADLGFIVVQIDGMGTANRSKAFHDVCWHNLKDAGFPDRIRWIQAAAEKYPYMDTTRVGIYGGSAGGQNAAAGVLFHPELYKVAVAGCGCHDNRMDKASWNEQWMGYPVGPHYAECSNIDNAHRLEGKLMLILGELDENVPIESTTRFVDALIKADKDFEFVFVPGAGHGMGGDYGARRMREFFVRHLLGDEPSERNAAAAAEVAATDAAPEQSLPAKVSSGLAED